MAASLAAAQAEARRELTAVGFASDVEAVLRLVRPAAFFRPAAPAGEDTIPLGASKIGGRPDLPDSLSWPQDTSFLLQINLADVPPDALDIDLPREGLLSCFRDNEEWANPVALIYTPPGAALQRRAPPEGAEAFEPRALVPSVVLTLDSDRDDIPEFDDDEVLDIIAEWVVPEHGVQLGGDRFVIQSGGRDDERLVLQIGSVEEVGMMWGDLGCLYISMTPKDLTARAFEKAVTDFQSF